MRMQINQPGCHDEPRHIPDILGGSAEVLTDGCHLAMGKGHVTHRIKILRRIYDVSPFQQQIVQRKSSDSLEC